MQTILKNKKMEDETIKNWEAKKEQIKKDYPHITEEDLAYQAGKEIELIERLKNKLDKNEEEIKRLLSYIGYD